MTESTSLQAHNDESRPGLLPSHYWEALSGERKAYEKFIQLTFDELIDRRSSPDDDNYMAWEMLVGWKVWQHCMIILRDSILRHRVELAVLLRNAALDEIEMRNDGDTSDLWVEEASPENVIALIDMMSKES